MACSLIVAAPLAWFTARTRVTRPTRLALGVVIGLFSAGFGVVSHGLHVVNSDNRAYRDARPSAELYEIPEAGHTAGLAARPKEYEARVTAFLGEVLRAH